MNLHHSPNSCGVARMMELCTCEKGPCKGSLYFQRSMVRCFVIKNYYVIVLSIFFILLCATTENNNTKNNSLWIMWILHLCIFYINISTSKIQENKYNEWIKQKRPHIQSSLEDLQLFQIFNWRLNTLYSVWIYYFLQCLFCQEVMQRWIMVTYLASDTINMGRDVLFINIICPLTKLSFQRKEKNTNKTQAFLYFTWFSKGGLSCKSNDVFGVYMHLVRNVLNLVSKEHM